MQTISKTDSFKINIALHAEMVDILFIAFQMSISVTKPQLAEKPLSHCGTLGKWFQQRRCFTILNLSSVNVHVLG